jgi:hypothetical protein
MTRNSWRRTVFESISGDVEIAPDDWTLLNPSGEPLARLCKVFGGPQNGGKRWNWIYGDGARGAGSLRGALTGNDARSASIIARFGDARLRGHGGQAPRGYIGRYQWREVTQSALKLSLKPMIGRSSKTLQKLIVAL